MVFCDTYHPPRDKYRAPPYVENNLSDNLFDNIGEIFDFSFFDDINTDTSSTCFDENSCELSNLERTLLCDVGDDVYIDDNNFLQNKVPSNAEKHKLFFSLQWTHKKGKKKPQQFWVYCEDKQQSYSKISLKTDKVPWSSSSRMFIFKEQHFCFVNNFNPNNNTQQALCLEYDDNEFIGIENNIETKDLIAVDLQKVELNFILEADTENPVHPQQGCASDVSMTYKVGKFDSSSFTEPFQFCSMFSFKNRVEGWFKLRIILSYAGMPLITSFSDLFMFNNPRLKKRKELAKYPPVCVKFIQIYALTRDANPAQWLKLAEERGYTINNDTLELATSIFTRSNKRKFPPEYRLQSNTNVPIKIRALPSDSCDQSTPVSLPEFEETTVTKTYLCQWLSNDGKFLEPLVFLTVPLVHGKSYFQQFMIEAAKRFPTREIKALYLQQYPRYFEIHTATDFDCYTSGQTSPQLVLCSSPNLIPNIATVSSPSINAPIEKKTFTFTVKDKDNNIREIYTNSKSFDALKSSIIDEFSISPSTQTKITLTKASTGALIFKDINVIHIAPSDLINVFW